EAKAEQKARAARQTWLVVMSLMVSAVGITNSMLMSVTERFREIGTMKCLGALDEFIVRLFLIESAVLGLLGSIVGALVGHLVMLVVYLAKQSDVAAWMNWGQMLEYIGIAVMIGVFLSLLAAVPPAVRAARMPPAAALQTEI
ncbi:MAG: ABC transporter permease, partial [Armatimonadota bacterium]